MRALRKKSALFREHMTEFDLIHGGQPEAES